MISCGKKVARPILRLFVEGSGIATVVVSILQTLNIYNANIWFVPLPVIMLLCYVVLRIIGISIAEIKDYVVNIKNENEINELKSIIDERKTEIETNNNQPVEDADIRTYYNEPV